MCTTVKSQGVSRSVKLAPPKVDAFHLEIERYAPRHQTSKPQPPNPDSQDSKNSDLPTNHQRWALNPLNRPLLSGTPPQGILLKGAGDAGGDKVVHCKGPSAGQSAFFYLIDDVGSQLLCVEISHQRSVLQCSLNEVKRVKCTVLTTCFSFSPRCLTRCGEQLLGVSHMGEAGAFKAEMLAEYIPREHRVVVQDFRSEVCLWITLYPQKCRKGRVWKCSSLLAWFSPVKFDNRGTEICRTIGAQTHA
jgi:hypothetical protein